MTYSYTGETMDELDKLRSKIRQEPKSMNRKINLKTAFFVIVVAAIAGFFCGYWVWLLKLLFP